MIDLDPNEKIILKVRRHKLALVFESFFLGFFVVLPPILFFISESIGSVRGNDTALFLVVYSFILLLAWMIFFMIWTDYYLDVLLVTDKRVVDVEQKGFFSREVATVRLDNIEDISLSVSGILGTFMDFGTLRIQTAAESREFIIKDVPEPNKIKSIIYDLHNKQKDAPQPVKVVS